ncbi:MAG TPA: hypothetical protein VF278_25000 [Pirellulales bacterium]
MLLEPDDLEVRNALIPRLDLVDDFVSDNAAGLTNDELEIVRSWRHGHPRLPARASTNGV